jgi:cytochrome P450
MTEETSEHGVDLLSMHSELALNPQPTYQMLREASPVLQAEGIGVIVSSRAAVDEVLRDPATFSSGLDATDLKTRRPLIPLQIDPPIHRTFRKILDPLFAPQRVKHLEEPVAALANELIDAFVAEDEIDFSQQFSIPLPSQVFLTMLGLPLDELPRFLRMKDGIIRPDQVSGEPRGNPATETLQQETADSIYTYFEELLDARADERHDDLISRLLDAEVDGDRLGRTDILDICFLFLIAGLDTVSASLDCFFGYLAQHPDARREIVAQPERIPSVVEELLRWETPVMAVARVATQDAEIGGCPVHKGDQVMALIGAANLDDAEFPDAGKVQWDREGNRHLSFGGGIHRCLGSHLARLELRIALREWHRRIPDYQVKPGATLEYTPGIRSLETFPMLLGSPRG